MKPMLQKITNVTIMEETRKEIRSAAPCIVPEALERTTIDFIIDHFTTFNLLTYYPRTHFSQSKYINKDIMRKGRRKAAINHKMESDYSTGFKDLFIGSIVKRCQRNATRTMNTTRHKHRQWHQPQLVIYQSASRTCLTSY